jgi:hypothetical protein
MKKIVILSLLVVGAATLASATSIFATCPTAGGSGASGVATTTCNTAGGPVGATSLDSLVLTYRFDAGFGLGAGSVNENFSLLDPGSVFGGALDHPTDQAFTVNPDIVGTFTILNPTLAQVNAALGGLEIQGKWDSGTGSFDRSVFGYSVQVGYTTPTSSQNIVVACPTSAGGGASGLTTTTCNTAGGPVGATSLDSLTLTYSFDATFGIGAGSVNENFALLDPGSVFGGELDHPTDQAFNTNPGIVGTFTILNPTLAEVNAALGGLEIQGKWDSGTGSFNNSAFDYTVQVGYTTATSAPEPATAALVLVGLGFLIPKKRSARIFKPRNLL